MNDPIPHCVVCQGTEYVAPFPTRTELGVCAFCDFEAPVGHCEECRRPIGDQQFVLQVADDRFHRPCLRLRVTQATRAAYEDMAEIPPIPGYEVEAQRVADAFEWVERAKAELVAVGYRFAR